MLARQIFHTKMMPRRPIWHRISLFNTDVYELPPRVRLDIMESLRREMIESSAKEAFINETMRRG